jgi:hypothetical protein
MFSHQKKIFLLPFIIWLTASILFSTAQADATLVILRHAEKNKPARGQISCQGLNRALTLPDVLLNKYGRPNRIYAPNPAVMLTDDDGNLYPYLRPLATIEPLAIKIGQPVITSFGVFDVEGVVTSIYVYPEGTMFIAWEHKMGELLAKKLMTTFGGSANDIPVWSSDDFDSLYVIRLAKDAKTGQLKATFSHEKQGIKTPPTGCPVANKE